MKNRNNGFTLLELIIVVGILGVVMTITSTFFFSGYFNLNKTEKKLDMQRDMQVVVKQLEEVSKSSIEFATLNKGGTTIYGFISNLKLAKDEVKKYVVIYYVDSNAKLINKKSIFTSRSNKTMNELLREEMDAVYSNVNIEENIIASKVNKVEMVTDGDFLKLDIELKDEFRKEIIEETYSGRIYMRNQKDK